MKKLLFTVAAILAIAFISGCSGSPDDNGGGSKNTNTITQKTIKDAPDAVGDIVLKDGKAIAYYDSLTLTDQEKADAIAVIFYAGGNSELGNRILGVGLYEYYHTRSYYTKDSNTSGTKFNAANDETNGLNNQQVMENYSDYKEEYQLDFEDFDDFDNSKYPAFHWAENYYDWEGVDIPWDNNPNALCKNWYVPAKKELSALLKKNAVINKAFDKISNNAVKFGNKSYWSSTTANIHYVLDSYDNDYYYAWIQGINNSNVQEPEPIEKERSFAVRVIRAF